MVMKRVLLFIVLASMILVGCKTTEKIVYVEVPRVEKEYVYLERRDTAYQKDSVFIKEFVKGDTVKVVEYRYRDRFHETTRIDTITRVDSCVVKVPVEVVKIDHKQTYFQKSFMCSPKISTWAAVPFSRLSSAVVVVRGSSETVTPFSAKTSLHAFRNGNTLPMPR